jgi:hypothetical protein
MLVTDFRGSGFNMEWFAVNDTVMGGRSKGSFLAADGTLEFSGILNTNGGGFSSVRSRPRELGLASTEGVRLRVRGDGREYTMLVIQRDAGGVSYRARFRAPEGSWTDVWLPYRSFVPMWRGRLLDRPPLEAARIESLGFMIADKRDGPFRLEVDSIQAYAPFAMETYRWNSRPLVVFAPDATDERLAAQLAAVEEARDAFRERDMELIVVLADGASRAGLRPLSKSNASQLRKRYGVARGEFAVRLIGKDGGVKRSGSETFRMSEVFAQIDSMPMRRAEIAERRNDRD